MKRHVIAVLLAPLLLALAGCRHPRPLPQKAIQVQVSSTPVKAALFLAGKPIGEAPQAISVGSTEELLQVTASAESEQVVEKRIRFLSLDQAEVIFVFGLDNSAMARTLGLPRILVFDYGAGVTFEVDQSRLKPEFLPLLERQAGLLKSNFSSQDVFVCGHTDSQGTVEHNLALSLERARSVADDLTGRGVAKERMKIQGFGSTYPLATNDSELGRAMNRRTELILAQ